MHANTVSTSLLSCCCLLMCGQAIASGPDETESKEEVVAQLPPSLFDLSPDCPRFMTLPGLDDVQALPPGPPNSAFFTGGPMPVRAGHVTPPMIPPPPDVALTDNQVEQLSKIKRDTRNLKIPIEEKVISLEHARSLALEEENLNQSEISKQSAEINKQKQLLDCILTEARIQMAQVLTGEQRHKIRVFAERLDLGPLGLKMPPAVPADQP